MFRETNLAKIGQSAKDWANLFKNVVSRKIWLSNMQFKYYLFSPPLCGDLGGVVPFRIGRHTTLFRARKKKEIDRLSRKKPYQRSTFAVHTMRNSAERKKRKKSFFSFSWEIWAGKMVVFCNAEEGKMERGHTSIAFPHVSTDAAFCEKTQKKSF